MLESRGSTDDGVDEYTPWPSFVKTARLFSGGEAFGSQHIATMFPLLFVFRSWTAMSHTGLEVSITEV
jgi:hypothetical protein